MGKSKKQRSDGLVDLHVKLLPEDMELLRRLSVELSDETGMLPSISNTVRKLIRQAVKK